jgi:hypothetical protein
MLPDATSAGAGSSTTTLTIAHTCTGSDRLLVVGAIDDGGASNIATAAFNGVAMTLVASTQQSGSEYVYLFYLKNPASGTHNIVITTSVASNPAASNASYTGALQTGGTDATATVTAGTRSSTTGTVTTVLNNCWLIMVGRAGTNMSAGASTTRRESTYAAGPGIFDSNGAITPAGSASLIFTNSSATTSAIIASFAPVVTTTRNRLALLGVS